MLRVFICYRRDDSAYAARAIFDRLAAQFGDENVFLDVKGIDAGEDWTDVLSARVGACDALLAVIGKSWLTSADRNERRLDDPEDFVRFEIQSALERKVRVIPVLIDGAAMPRAESLPDGLKPLARRQAIEISHARFDADVKALSDALAAIDARVPRVTEAQGTGAFVPASPSAGAQANDGATAKSLSELFEMMRGSREPLTGAALERWKNLEETQNEIFSSKPKTAEHPADKSYSRWDEYIRDPDKPRG